MASKLRGSRLETEIDKCRGECNWTRLSEHLPSIRSKSGGVEKLMHLIEGELSLETFLEKYASTRETSKPRTNHREYLRRAEGELRNAITNNPNEQTIVMEAYLLLAKLYYFCGGFSECLSSIERSQVDKASTQFASLRSLKLVAEGYAIKGLAFEQTLPKDSKDNLINTRVISCFEKSAELFLSYISELERASSETTRASSVPTGSSGNHPPSKIGVLKGSELLETVLERVAYLALRRNNNERRWAAEGIEWYRRIATILCDKIIVVRLQQRITRQLAEILLRGMIDVGYDSKAINLKSESLRFYTGSHKNYFSPSSRQEEVILLLLISELLAFKNIKSTGSDDDAFDRIRAMHTLRSVHNLLAVSLSNIRQYNMLSMVYERAMKYASKDRFLWFQFGLSLTCAGKLTRATKSLEHCVKLESEDKYEVTEHMMIAKINTESLGDYDLAMEHASMALSLCKNNFLSSRCMLMYAIAFSEKLASVSSFETCKVLMGESLRNFEKAIDLDPHDELAHFFTALEYARCRDIERALEHCQRSLDINEEQPSAIMLMAMLFSARRDYKSALTLVQTALDDLPNHYGLLVLKLKLDAKYGRMDEVLITSKHLLSFWRRLPITYNNVISDDGEVEYSRMNGLASEKPTESTLNSKNNASMFAVSSKDALAPVTPIFTAPLGISAASHVSLNNSNLDITDNVSVLASTAANLSEYGGATSTISGSLGILSSGSAVCSVTSAFRIQANVWVELAEFFIELDRAHDLQTCVEEACSIFPHSHEALYLKGRLFFIRSNKSEQPSLKTSYRAEAKSCLLAALSILPNHLPSLQCLASLYHAENNLVLAEKMIRDIINVDPLHHMQWHELGRILASQGRYEEAQECFETAGVLESTTPIIPFTVIPRLLKSNNF
uniref:TTC7_N domain-containing protein n=1 Tax=Panagrellus redivivus TaxID=6233 RepID=A0A7E4VXZ7_PANRE